MKLCLEKEASMLYNPPFVSTFIFDLHLPLCISFLLMKNDALKQETYKLYTVQIKSMSNIPEVYNLFFIQVICFLEVRQ